MPSIETNRHDLVFLARIQKKIDGEFEGPPLKEVDVKTKKGVYHEKVVPNRSPVLRFAVNKRRLCC